MACTQYSCYGCSSLMQLHFRPLYFMHCYFLIILFKARFLCHWITSCLHQQTSSDASHCKSTITTATYSCFHLKTIFPGESGSASYSSGLPLPPILEENLWGMVEKIFHGPVSFLPPNNQHQSTARNTKYEGGSISNEKNIEITKLLYSFFSVQSQSCTMPFSQQCSNTFTPSIKKIYIAV